MYGSKNTALSLFLLLHSSPTNKSLEEGGSLRGPSPHNEPLNRHTLTTASIFPHSSRHRGEVSDRPTSPSGRDHRLSCFSARNTLQLRFGHLISGNKYRGTVGSISARRVCWFRLVLKSCQSDPRSDQRTPDSVHFSGRSPVSVTYPLPLNPYASCTRGYEIAASNTIHMQTPNLAKSGTRPAPPHSGIKTNNTKTASVCQDTFMNQSSSGEFRSLIKADN